MNWQKGLKRLRIVFSVLGFLAGLIILGIVFFRLVGISASADALSRTKVEIYEMEHAEIISVPGTNQPKFRYKQFDELSARYFTIELDAESYKQKLKDLQELANGLRRELNSAWKQWFVATIVGGFVSLIVVWFILRVISWIILGFFES
jgi:hypothetical protein